MNTNEIKEYIKNLRDKGYSFTKDAEGIYSTFKSLDMLENPDIALKIKRLKIISPNFKFSSSGFHKKIFRDSGNGLYRLIVVRVRTTEGLTRFFLAYSEGYKYCKNMIELLNF